MGDEKDIVRRAREPQALNSSLDGQVFAQNTTTPPITQQPATATPVVATPTNTIPIDRFPDKGNKEGNKEAAIEAFFADPANTELSAKKQDPAAVREVQQALIDLKQLDPKAIKQVGIYDKATEKAVISYRKSRGGTNPVVKKGGGFDQQDKTLVEDHFKDREAYVEAATGYDPTQAEAGTRPLDNTDKTALGEVYGKPPKTGAKKAAPTATGKLTKQEEQLRKLFFLTYKGRIYDAYKINYQSKLQQRQEGEKAEKTSTVENEFLFTKSSIEDIANTAKEVVDSLYKSMASTAPSFKTGVNIFDYWEEQEKKHPTVDDGKGNIKPTAQKDAAYFFVNALQPQVDKAENMEGEKQKYARSTQLGIDKITALQQLAIEDLYKDKKIVEMLLKAEQGMSGVAEDGKQSLQRFKSTNPDAPQKMEEDRLKRWGIFYTSIHEYLHLLKHKDYKTWLNTFKNPKRRILAEGMCEFFTLNVYAKFPPSALKGSYQDKIEGRTPATEKVPTHKEAGKRIYPEHKKAEQLARTAGIHNLQAAYFQGKTDLLDDTITP